MSVTETAPLVGAITVNWNNDVSTLKTLASLSDQRYSRLITIVVDNASANQVAALARIAEEYPAVRTVASRENLGYGGGCNLGMRAALDLGADYVFLLNNDVVLDPNAIGELVASLEHDPTAGAACPFIYLASAPDTVWFGGGTMLTGPRMLPRIDHEGQRLPAVMRAPARATDWLAGTALLAGKDAVKAAGMMDDTYFLYWEDVDWSFRLRRAGYRLLVVPQARIWHSVNASRTTSETLTYYWERNHLLFIERWGSWWARLVTRMKVRARLAGWKLFGVSRNEAARIRMEAYGDYLHRRFGRRGDGRDPAVGGGVPGS